MKKFFTYILTIIFLLAITGSKLMAIGQGVPKIDSVENVVSTHKNSLRLTEHHVNQLQQVDNGFTSIENDLQDLDFFSNLQFFAVAVKVLVFAFILSFLNTKYKKRHFFYDAFIRLFSSKYIVLRTLRI